MHHIVVLGAGYAGAGAAGYLARRLGSDEVEITVVNAEPHFVERLRLHQLVAGHPRDPIPLSKVFEGTGIRLRVAYVTAVDPVARTVTIRTKSTAATVPDQHSIDETSIGDTETLEYDTLLYALGSGVDASVPGVGQHAFDLATRPTAERLRDRLDELEALAEHGHGDSVLVVGGNLTAIEAATEIAESRPTLDIQLVTAGQLGGWLGPTGRAHLLGAFERLGIEVHEHATVTRVEPDGLVTADGRRFRGTTVWAAGFAVPPIAAASGLEVQDSGRILVDRTMRSVSHPTVYAIGDSAYVIGDNGQPLPMSCASASLTRMRATAAIVHQLTGSKSPNTRLTYFGNCISLGQRDGILQVADGAGQARSWAVTGRPAALVKAGVLNGTVWNLTHPTLGMPSRKRRLANSQDTRGDRRKPSTDDEPTGRVAA